jgi:hypothetical protein
VALLQPAGLSFSRRNKLAPDENVANVMIEQSASKRRRCDVVIWPLVLKVTRRLYQ